MVAKPMWIIVLVCFLGRLGIASTSVPLIYIDPAKNFESQLPGLIEPHTSGTWGWSFYVTAPITITAVGWYDENGDGLSHSHKVGLWKDVNGLTNWPYVKQSRSLGLVDPEQLLFFLAIHVPGFTDGITVPAGTVAELDGVWRKTSLAEGPMVLSPGGYVLGGVDNLMSTDSIRFGQINFAHGIVIDPRITVGGGGYSEEAGFHPPNIFFLLDGVELGPMLFVEPVPEPSTGLLLLAAIPCRRRWR